MNNREKLIEIMIEQKLERSELAQMLKVKGEPIDHWLVPNEARTHEEVPDMAIELLQLKLGRKS